MKTFFKEIFNKTVFNKNFLKASRFLYFSKTNPQPLEFDKNEKCLLLAPHPDDETFGCGGLLTKYPDNFHVVCLTDGIHGNFDKTPDHEQIKKNRQNEFISALAVAGVKSYQFLEIPDRKLIKHYDTFKTLDLSKYDYIFLPNYMDNHKDHKAVTVLLQKLLRESEHKNNCKIAFYEIWGALPIFNYYADITFIRNQKIKMINCYMSQLKNLDFLKGIIGLNKYRGTCVNLGFTEVFSVTDIETFKKL